MISSSPVIRVLHVDDEPDFADMTATFLEREDDRLTVETATSAPDGLARLKETDFDCIVSDYEMPEQNGISFLKRVRESNPDLPFILFTGKGSEDIASEAISAGVTDYLQKETGTDQYTLLANRITQAVSRRRAETNYEEIFEKATDGILIHDPETGEVLDANQRFCEMNGYPRDDVVGMRITDFSVDEPPYTEAHGRQRIQSANEGDPQVFEWVNETKSGSRLPVEVHLKHTTIGGHDCVLALVHDISDRKAREDELDQAQTIVETIVQYLPMGVLVEDADRTILRTNDTFFDIFELDASTGELTESDCAAAADELKHLFADPDDFQTRIEEIIAAREHVRNEVIELADGRILERDYIPYELPDGDANLWLYRDVTERTAHQEEIDRYETIVEHSEEGIYLFDADGRFQFVNDRVATVSGIPQEAWIDEHVSILADAGILSEDEITAVEDAIDAITTGAETEVRLDVTLDVPDDVSALELRFTPFEPETGDACVIGFSRDISRRKQREKLLKSLFENAPAPIIYTEFVADSPIVRDVNAAFEDVFGYDTETAIGQSLDDLIVPDQHQSEATDLNQRVIAGEQFEVDVRRKTPNGLKDFYLHSVPLHPDESGVESYAIYYDVTERNEYKRELERQNDRLDEFASVVSHDLRNPLNVASGHLELVRDDYSSDHLDAIADALDRSQTLIDDLLTLARNGQTVSDHDPVDLESLTTQCWHTVETPHATLEIETNQTISADESRLMQLLENLIRNAIDHAGPDTTITVGDLPTGFYVADDGPGIPESNRDTVFEIGYTTDTNGTGFGLSIVQEIAQAHGWTITITDSKQGGARFDITNVDTIDSKPSR